MEVIQSPIVVGGPKESSHTEQLGGMQDLGEQQNNYDGSLDRLTPFQRTSRDESH